ncbi:hypothetical protein [Pseudonocardia oroxyli]|uniref:ChrR Cupin-like domain-containing protein n=1 Tax=Pseudonocardia oroxyli TaxID=366584 RepID=A0A1G7TM65_PSEOR|nr:hypothetical protein [Pseudonocardia oroxyli]SDG36291.1 hypothetical protein SAMN05216377_11174 [Pseudonocardia oroxyli]
MKYFPFGSTPTETPQWFVEALASTHMNPETIPLWFLGSDELGWKCPAALLLTMPADYTLFRHGHPCQRFEIVIQGSLELGDGRVASVGDTFTADPNTLYGPHTAGPQGCTTIEIFSAVEGMFRLLHEDENGRMVETDSRLGQSAPGYVPLDLAKV